MATTNDSWETVYLPVYVQTMVALTAREPLFRETGDGFHQQTVRLRSEHSHWERAVYAHEAAMAAMAHFNFNAAPREGK